jgi:hypothetical protein
MRRPWVRGSFRRTTLKRPPASFPFRPHKVAAPKLRTIPMLPCLNENDCWCAFWGPYWPAAPQSWLMFKRKRLLVCILVLLYAGTWACGWTSHAHNLRTRAEASYRMAERDNQEMEIQAQRSAGTFHRVELRKGGPTSGVNWCVPVLPGILIADSYYSAGPLRASGGVKIVVYYGFGSTELCTPWCWTA